MIADVLADAAEEIRDSLVEYPLENYDNLAREIMCVLASMDALRIKIDNMGSEVERLANEVIDREIAAGRIIDLGNGRLHGQNVQQRRRACTSYKKAIKRQHRRNYRG
jgi:hypothetical protein